MLYLTQNGMLCTVWNKTMFIFFLHCLVRSWSYMKWRIVFHVFTFTAQSYAMALVRTCSGCESRHNTDLLLFPELFCFGPACERMRPAHYRGHTHLHTHTPDESKTHKHPLLWNKAKLPRRRASFIWNCWPRCRNIPHSGFVISSLTSVQVLLQIALFTRMYSYQMLPWAACPD